MERTPPAVLGPRSDPESQWWDLPLTGEGDGVHLAASRQRHHVDPDLQQSLPAAVGTLERGGKMGSMRAPTEETQSLSLPDPGHKESRQVWRKKTLALLCFLNQFMLCCPHTSSTRLWSWF